MKLAVVASLLLAVQGLTGCMSSFEIPVSEVPRLPSGMVYDVEGEPKEVPVGYSVRLVAQEGQVLLRDRPWGTPPGDPTQNVWAAPKGTDGRELGWMEGPLRGTLEDGYFHLGLAKGDLVVPEGSVGGFEIGKYSTGKTAGLLAGVLGGGTLVAVVIAIVASSRPSWNVGGGYR